MSMHDDAHEHEHLHGHPHTHSHEHAHAHGAAQAASPEETLALLDYMLSHNKHHTEELHGLAHQVSANAAQLLQEAVSEYEQCNAKLAEAVRLLKEG